MLSREQAGEWSLLLGLTSATCREMEGSPSPRSSTGSGGVSIPSCSMASVLWARASEQDTWSEDRKTGPAPGCHAQGFKWPICRQCYVCTNDTSQVCGRSPRWPSQGMAPAHGEGAGGPGPRSSVHRSLTACLSTRCVMRAGLLEQKEPACLLEPQVLGVMWGRCFRGGPPPGRLHEDIHQDRPLFPQAGVPGSSVGASTVFKVKLQEHDRSLTLDPPLLTASKLGLFLISMTFIGEKAAQQSHTIPCHAKAPGWGLDLRRQPRERGVGVTQTPPRLARIQPGQHNLTFWQKQKETMWMEGVCKPGTQQQHMLLNVHGGGSAMKQECLSSDKAQVSSSSLRFALEPNSGGF